MQMQTASVQKRLYLFTFVLILILATLLRIYSLEADAPINLSLVRGLTTDGPTTIAAARSKIHFDTWVPETRVYNSYSSFPLMSWLAYSIFYFLDVGYWQANFVSVITGLLSVAMFTAFSARHFGRRMALLTALFLATNYVYVMYNRIPMVYTTLNLAIGIALYCWGSGIRRSVWLFGSILISLLSIFFLKLAGIAFFMATVASLLILVGRGKSALPRRFSLPVVFLSLTALCFIAVASFFFLAPQPMEQLAQYAREFRGRTFNPAHGGLENIRFAVQAMLQFGIYSSFFARMVPLFILSYGYLLYRGSQLFSINRRMLPASELIILLYLLFTTLLLMAVRSEPLRYMTLLIPPMSMLSALALDRWLERDHAVLPVPFNRFFPVYLQLASVYFLYQLLAAAVKLFNALRLQTGVADVRLILDGATRFTLLFFALLPATLMTIAVLWWILQAKQTSIPLPPIRTRVYIALFFIAASVSSDFYQYFTWARAPQFTLVQASRQIAHYLPESAVLGGPYANVLSLENRLSAYHFFLQEVHSPGLAEQWRNFEQLYLTLEAESLWASGDQDYLWMVERFPDLMQHARLAHSFDLRGEVIHIYEVKPFQEE
jgi:hypothetical protein